MSDKNQKVYFYQNNPCVIIRDVGDDFAEIRLSHRFAEDLEGSGWCTACVVGGIDGSHHSHTCEEHQNIIDCIQEEENAVICMVEKRLLNKNPIEKKTIDKLQAYIETQKEELKKIKGIREEWNTSSLLLKQKVENLSKEYDVLTEAIKIKQEEKDTINKGLDKLASKRNKLLIDIDSHSIRNKKISFAEYERLIKRDKKLEALENGGVCNWEWYDESLKEAGL